MKVLKNISMIALAGLVTYLGCNYFFKPYLKNIMVHDEVLIDEKHSITATQINQAQKLTMTNVNMKSQTFYQNTYQSELDENNLPKLKHGKHYYDEALMEQIATSANLEEINSENE